MSGGAGWRVLAMAAVAVWPALSCRGEAPAPPPAVVEAPERLRVRVLRSLPHDPRAFTQGLIWDRGSFYESVGQYGASAVRRVEPESGRVMAEAPLPFNRFGEGLERVGAELVQLTWRSGEALVWDLESLQPVRRHTYRGEGWGLCRDGGRLVRSDGSDRLVLHDPASFAELGELRVRLGGRPRDGLNELECAEGWIYANVWQRDEIVRIDPSSGVVGAVIDASGLLTADERRAADVLNGIAFDPETARFYLTGKYWPRLFEVVFVPAG